ncbi:MAG: hypothetical protein FJ145_18135 [Deltaproteobacteria bacterium]|nr:hypothetical protein [Deltaproteobacteria bacterium]
MYNGPVIDADGHVLEKEKYIRKYLGEPWNKRSTALRTREVCHYGEKKGESASFPLCLIESSEFS